MLQKSILVGCTIVAVALAGCQRTTTGEAVGGLGGAAAGGAIGSAAGGELATAIGVLGGALLGREIGRAAEGQDSVFGTGDQASVEQATLAALETGQPQRFDTGRVEGTVDVGEGFHNDRGHLCREYHQRVFLNGDVVEDHGTACRTASGWTDV